MEHKSNRLAPAESLILRELERAALAKSPCPTNTQLAKAANCKDRSAARKILDRLRHKGLIEITTTPKGRRAVTIMSSGQKTAPSSWKRGKRDPQKAYRRALTTGGDKLLIAIHREHPNIMCAAANAGRLVVFPVSVYQ